MIDSYIGLMYALPTKEEYDRWHYHYPEFDATQKWAKVPSQALSDMLADALKEDITKRKKS